MIRVSHFWTDAVFPSKGAAQRRYLLFYSTNASMKQQVENGKPPACNNEHIVRLPSARLPLRAIQKMQKFIIFQKTAPIILFLFLTPGTV
jgi:hypothetical protein